MISIDFYLLKRFLYWTSAIRHFLSAHLVVAAVGWICEQHLAVALCGGGKA
jgi:hypothetical protein